MTECAIMIALATILSLIKVFELPWGGSITAASMLPLVIVGYRHGIKWGILSSVIYSLIQMLLGGSTISAAFLPGDDQMKWYLAVIMVLLDYFFAFSLVGLSGLFRNKNKPSKSLALGALVGTSARFVMHFLSGWILWGAWAAYFFEGFDETTGGSFGKFIVNTFDGQMLACVYSLIYNAMYMIPEILITVILAIFIGKIPYISKDIE
ncbi:MAG: energy-coupled thiamine transporter ThiT [Ruminococcaceae bacterium]|nr:energy-coupled thiamine transporter ThiT [Oscillospiraceae bacterium]